MKKIVSPFRTFIIYFFIAVLFVVFITILYKMQIVDGQGSQASAESLGITSTTRTVSAQRGSILDRNGVLLAADRVVYNVKISRSMLLNQDDPNGTVLSLVRAANQYGVSYRDTFPVTMSAPFSFTADPTGTQSSWLSSYLDYFGIDSEISATELISWMRTHYGIDYTVTAEDARLIIGVRYELEIRAIINTSDYIFAEDVDSEFVSYLLEQGLNGVSVETSSEREYYTTYASHVIGYTGSMDSDEYQNTYKDQGYAYNSTVGKSGAEYAFESYLHGTDGSVTTYTDSTGAVTDEVVNTQAEAGSNVYLTIDIALQAVAEDSLSSTIEEMNAEREASNAVPGSETQELAEGGAVVAIDVNSGEVLVCASYPTYDLSTLSENYASISSDSLAPMWNRATSGTYNPGSTFKMVTALAALNSGIVSPYTTIVDEGRYTAYEGYQPTCWIYSYGITHGALDVVGALENSCNYYFYWVADKMGITPIAQMAEEFGLGSKTGIEIGEATGTVASREYKLEALNEGWWAADTLMAAIGQSYNLFTPIQMANYIATIANGGTRYTTTVLKYITSSDYSDILLQKEPEVANIIDDSNGYFSFLQKGMRAVVNTGTAAEMFEGYDISVAAKTGTTQSDSTNMNTGVFVCYAPADNPEIAIAVVVEKAGAGSSLANIAKDIMTAYFSTDSISITYYPDNSLIP